mmetsp:Transcript_48539/g.122548  ORF Transcript_48539/g.122548 Transcript_48539/m.122548 type:complete len:212 (-) Transcript_48539:1884-2519(-)
MLISTGCGQRSEPPELHSASKPSGTVISGDAVSSSASKPRRRCASPPTGTRMPFMELAVRLPRVRAAPEPSPPCGRPTVRNASPATRFFRNLGPTVDTISCKLSCTLLEEPSPPPLSPMPPSIDPRPSMMLNPSDSKLSCRLSNCSATFCSTLTPRRRDSELSLPPAACCSVSVSTCSDSGGRSPTSMSAMTPNTVASTPSSSPSSSPSCG